MEKRRFIVIGILTVFLAVGIVFYLGHSQQKKVEMAFDKISGELWETDHKIISISYRPDKKEVAVELSDQEPNLASAMKEIKDYIKTEFKTRRIEAVSVVVKSIDIQKAEIERKWMSVAPEIDKELKSLSNKYTGIAIDFNPKPIKYILKTSYSNMEFDGEESEKWIDLANKIIVSNNLSDLLKRDETYEIKITDTNNEVLQSEIFEKKVD